MGPSGISNLMHLLLDAYKFKILFQNLPWGSSASSTKQANKQTRLAWSWAAPLHQDLKFGWPSKNVLFHK